MTTPGSRRSLIDRAYDAGRDGHPRPKVCGSVNSRSSAAYRRGAQHRKDAGPSVYRGPYVLIEPTTGHAIGSGTAGLVHPEAARQFPTLALAVQYRTADRIHLPAQPLDIVPASWIGNSQPNPADAAELDQWKQRQTPQLPPTLGRSYQHPGNGAPTTMPEPTAQAAEQDARDTADPLVTFKVWIEIERQDDNEDADPEHETLDAPGAAVATFDSYQEAYDFAAMLQRLGEQADGLDDEFRAQVRARQERSGGE